MKKVCRIIFALALLTGVAGVSVAYEPTPEPAAAAESRVWDMWVGGMYHNWFIRAEYTDYGSSPLMVLDAWRFSYSDPYNWAGAIHEVHSSGPTFLCWKILGGGHNVQPAKIQIVTNALNAGQSCDAPERDLQWHPTLGYCSAEDAAFLVPHGYNNMGYMGYEDGFYCPYDYPRGITGYGYWAPLDTSQDPRFTPGYHTFRLH